MNKEKGIIIGQELRWLLIKFLLNSSVTRELYFI